LLRCRRTWTEAYCRSEGLPFRVDSSNRDTARGLIREEILPLLRRLHPAADANLYRLSLRRTMPPELAELLDSPVGSRRLDLGGGTIAAREYDQVWLERAPVPLHGSVHWGDWTIESDLPGLKVRAWRAGHRPARGPAAAPDRRAQGGGLLHGRPDAPPDRRVRGGLHGDLELRRLDRLLGRRPDPEGPRHQHRRPGRARRRGHHRLRAHALVPDP